MSILTSAPTAALTAQKDPRGLSSIVEGHLVAAGRGVCPAMNSLPMEKYNANPKKVDGKGSFLAYFKASLSDY